MLPISFVSSAGFKKIMSVVEPAYKVPCESTIIRRLECTFEEVRSRIKEELAQAESVSLTTDEWSSRAQNSYLSVEAQYINKECIMKNATLCNQIMEERPTAANLQCELESVISDWDLDEKVESITHDSAAAVTLACESIEQVPNSVKCNAHLLQLALKDAFGAVSAYEPLLYKGRAVVTHFRKSNVASRSLAKCQTQMNMKNRRLIQSVDTRWNSKFHMLESLVQNKAPISAVLADRQVTKADVAQRLEILERDWENMEKLLPILKPFDITTTLFCSQSDVTISIVRPIIKSIISRHLDIKPEDNRNSSLFKQTAAASLMERFCLESEELSIMHISQFFDPRYQNLEYESAEIRDKVISHVKELLDSREPIDTEELPATPSTAFDFLFESTTSTNTWQEQLDKYNAEPVLGHNLNPLEWWKNHSQKYSVIFKLAMQYLSVPASSAASERTFSSAGNIVTPKRSCLSPENINLLTFLYQNRHWMNKNVE